jgi:thiol-disulfide isomerase/thioredoxin
MGQRLPILRSFSRFLIATMVLCLGCAPLISTSSPGSPTDLDGKPFDPFRAAQGKIVVLIFVRADCPVSNRYAPTIQQLGAQHKDKASFFLVYPSKRETAQVIRKHDRQFGFGPIFAALRDPQHILVKQSQAQITPEAAVFDAHQRLVITDASTTYMRILAIRGEPQRRASLPTPLKRPSRARR